MVKQSDHSVCLATIQMLRDQLTECKQGLRGNIGKTENLKKSYTKIIEELLNERELLIEAHERQWKEILGRANEIVKLHDDNVADKLSAMKIFFVSRLEDLEARNKVLRRELAKEKKESIPKERGERRLRGIKPTEPIQMKNQTMTEQEKEAFIAEDENELSMDIAMRLRIRKMRDCERLDALHSKRSYNIQNNRVISIGFGDKVQNFKFPPILGEESLQKDAFEQI